MDHRWLWEHRVLGNGDLVQRLGRRCVAEQAEVRMNAQPSPTERVISSDLLAEIEAVNRRIKFKGSF